VTPNSPSMSMAGTAPVYMRAVSKAGANDRLSTSFTESFYDIDLAGDLIKLAGELRLAPAKAPRTAAWFGEWSQEIADLRHSLGEL